ncbi:unnamed protein product [Diplocarpon coronariae]
MSTPRPRDPAAPRSGHVPPPWWESRPSRPSRPTDGWAAWGVPDLLNARRAGSESLDSWSLVRRPDRSGVQRTTCRHARDRSCTRLARSSLADLRCRPPVAPTAWGTWHRPRSSLGAGEREKQMCLVPTIPAWTFAFPDTAASQAALTTRYSSDERRVTGPTAATWHGCLASQEPGPSILDVGPSTGASYRVRTVAPSPPPFSPHSPSSQAVSPAGAVAPHWPDPGTGTGTGRLFLFLRRGCP